ADTRPALVPHGVFARAPGRACCVSAISAIPPSIGLAVASRKDAVRYERGPRIGWLSRAGVARRTGLVIPLIDGCSRSRPRGNSSALVVGACAFTAASSWPDESRRFPHVPRRLIAPCTRSRRRSRGGRGSRSEGRVGPDFF